MKSFAPSRHRLSGVLACTLAFSAPAAVGGGAEASPLDKGACAKLALDLQNLKALDVDKLMANGPVWAADHLSAGDLALVRQYIDLDEQMKFRCTAPGSLVRLKHLEDEDEDTAKPADTSAKERGENAGLRPKPKAAKASGKAKRPAESAGSR